MKILVIGSGGREHALVWKLAQSPSVSKLWCAPGNGGIGRDAECIPVDAANPGAIAGLAQRLSADLTVIGPELPLVNGVADEFAARRMRIFGPSQAAAELEGSKIFAKQFMHRHGIPTAGVLGEISDFADGRKLLQSLKFPAVLKADGLCAGKGVLVASELEEANEFLERSLVRKEFGEGGARTLVEEALSGPELSVIVATDGDAVVPMVPSRDHKLLLDGDRGPNTGGMGAYSTDELLPADLRKQVFDSIVFPTIKGLQKDGIPYCGFLYF
ncbi:MAG TPA: phosphoribosylamine--glycine ligase, partial [Candidatus Acidoferrales bacterium]|nr:phosphoribosylamine--glycine ligase [Candidatus Acidoferrales bacterium]